MRGATADSGRVGIVWKGPEARHEQQHTGQVREGWTVIGRGVQWDGHGRAIHATAHPTHEAWKEPRRGRRDEKAGPPNRTREHLTANRVLSTETQAEDSGMLGCRRG